MKLKALLAPALAVSSTLALSATSLADEPLLRADQYIAFIHFDECAKLVVENGKPKEWTGGTCVAGQLDKVTFGPTDKVQIDGDTLKIGTAATFEVDSTKNGFGGRHEITGTYTILKADGTTWSGTVIFKEVRGA